MPTRQPPDQGTTEPPHGASSGPIVALIPDLMAAVRVESALRAADLPTAVIDGAALPAALEGARALVVDLTAGPPALAAIEHAAAHGIPTLAYGPHVDTEQLAAARGAGAADVVPRGRFLQNAAALVTALVDG